MKTMIFLLSVPLLALAGAVGAASINSSDYIDRPAYEEKRANCNGQADARNFGIHAYQRDEFVIRCVAGLSHMNQYR